MLERKAGDSSGPARAGGVPEAGDLAQEAGRDPEATARRAWPRVEGPPASWDGFGKALASSVLRQLKAQEGGAAVTASMSKALGSIRDVGPSGESARHAELAPAPSEEPDLGRRAIVDGSRDLEGLPEPGPPPTDSEIVPAGLPMGSREQGREVAPTSIGTSESSRTPDFFASPLPDPTLNADRAFSSDLLSTPRANLEQFPRPGPSDPPAGSDGTASPPISIGGGIGSIAAGLTDAFSFAGSSVGERTNEVSGAPPEVRVPSIRDEAMRVGPGGVERGAGVPDVSGGMASRGVMEALAPESYGGSDPAAGPAIAGGSPYVIAAGPARMTGDYALDGPTASDLPVATSSPDLGGAMGAGPQGHGDPAVDMTRTNQLLQQLLDEMKKGRRGFLPAGTREVSPGR